MLDGSPVPGVLVSSDRSVAMLQLQFTTQVDSLPEGTTEELVDLTLAITAINSWNRMNVAFQSKAGDYRPGMFRAGRNT